MRCSESREIILCNIKNHHQIQMGSLHINANAQMSNYHCSGVRKEIGIWPWGYDPSREGPISK